MAKILVVASFTPSLLNFRGPLLRAFQDLGHQVVACSPDPDPASLLALTDMGIKHIEFPLQKTGLNPLADWKSYRTLLAIFQRENPSHILAYTIKPVIYGCLAAHRAGVLHIHALITGLGTSFQDGGLRQFLLNRFVSLMYRCALGRCETVMFQNPDDPVLFLKRKLVSSKKVVVVDGSGIDLEYFQQSPLPEKGPVFLLVARLIEDKGIRTYAEAARLIKCEYPDAIFRLVGYFEEHPRSIRANELEAWIAEGIIEYLGPVDDVRPHLAAAHVYCLPSFREGLPRSTLEALAVGRAIVTTDTPGCRETVLPGKNGFLVLPRDPKSLAAAMREFCKNKERAVQMGKASRELAEQRFDVNRVNQQVTSALGLT